MLQIWSPLELELMTELQGDLELELRYLEVPRGSPLVSAPRRSAERSLRELIARVPLLSFRGGQGSRPDTRAATSRAQAHDPGR